MVGTVSWDETVDFLDEVENDMLSGVLEDSWEADVLSFPAFDSLDDWDEQEDY